MNKFTRLADELGRTGSLNEHHMQTVIHALRVAASAPKIAAAAHVAGYHNALTGVDPEESEHSALESALSKLLDLQQ